MVRQTTKAVAVDGMGGDQAPHVPVLGALQAAKSGIRVNIFGDAFKIERLLGNEYPQWQSLEIFITNTTEIIRMDEEPAKAVRKKTYSSLVKAVQSVAIGDSCGVVSAGNSGAMMVASALNLGRADDVKRPAIGGFMPSFSKVNSSAFCLDLGANVDCKPEYLLQFAHMGIDAVTCGNEQKKPSVGLLSNGSEDCKGSALVKETHNLLVASNLNFIGNVEPQEVLSGYCDVVVTDGFTGNIFLKSVEAILNSFSVKHNTVPLAGWSGHVVAPAPLKLFGGARLLGVNGVVFIAHGAATAGDIALAVEEAYHVFCVENDVERFGLDKGDEKWMPF